MSFCLASTALAVFQLKINHIMTYKGFLNWTHFFIKFFQKKKKKAVSPSGEFQKSKCIVLGFVITIILIAFLEADTVLLFKI
jgi:hypothetical protein